MRKNRMIALAAVLSMVLLNGCQSVPDMTEQQSDMIAEYSAGVLLRYSDRYERRLITKKQLQKEENNDEQQVSPSPSAIAATAAPVSQTPEDQQVVDQSPQPDTTELPSLSVNEFYHLNGVTVSYDSYQFTKRYANTQIRAQKGETLLVVSFLLNNTSGRKKKLNLMNRTDLSYLLEVDGSQYYPGPSMLENGGMNELSTTLKAGQKEKAVLIYRMSKEKMNASSISLMVSDRSKQTKVILK